ncbi:UNVERIFIED_CONTAM: Folylpolyglutamate synthase [Sesamum radiatum]|uniref:Folylpolyglutamate synthase n=1 Tax=Sesamum radiatum TaxID=300843 RepID=A0AAW2NCV6_SESRA
MRVNIDEDGNGSEKLVVSSYDEAMEALSSLITKRSRADKSNKGDRFDLLFDYIKILELEEPIKQMKIIHVAGTKGKILLFNCMSVRDPQLLLPRLVNACASHGVHFKKALFVPNTSVYYKVGSVASPAADAQVDLSWQMTLQRLWESLILGEKGRDAKNAELTSEVVSDDTDKGAHSFENSTVFTSLPLTINWLRDSVQKINLFAIR